MFVINATDYAPVTPVTPPCDIIPIFIGYKGENHARCLIFDLTDCIEEFGDGGFAISFMRHGDAQPYIVTDTDSLETTAIWEINATDTAVEGYGMVQLQYIVGETVCKTAMYRTITFDSNESAGDVPDPYENLLDQIAAYAAAAQASASAAAQSAANASGEADRIIANTAEVVGDWLDDNIGEISGYVIDKSLTVSDAAADAKVAGDWIRASFITDTASGAVASFPDGADGVPVKDLTVSVQAQQSGTGDPSPSNVRSISGWSQAQITRAGKNLCAPFTTQTSNGVTFTVHSDGTVTLSGTASEQTRITTTCALQQGTYTLSGAPSGSSSGSYDLYLYEQGTSTVIARDYTGSTYQTFTLSKATTVVVNLRVPSGAVDTAKSFKPMIRLASDTDATYEPYTSTTYTVSFGSAGTVYGGTLDVTTGVLTVTQFGFKPTSWQPNSTNSYSVSVFAAYPSSIGLPSGALDFICSVASAKYLNANNIATYGTICYGNASTRNVVIASDINTYPTQDALKQALLALDVTIVGTLAQPVSYQLTPTEVKSLLANNNIFADCGGSDVTYRADPRLYLEKLTNPDSDMTADANIVSGQYFMVGNQLYLATANIANGGAIIVGTNCTLTNLAAALNAINS